MNKPMLSNLKPARFYTNKYQMALPAARGGQSLFSLLKGQIIGIHHNNMYL